MFYSMYMFRFLNSIIHVHVHVLHFLMQAGMVEEMNVFASRFVSESEKRDEIISEASAVAEGHEDPK